MEHDGARSARIAANEAVFRTVNEKIEELNRGFGTIVGDDSMVIVCECGDLTCSEQLTVPLDTYEKIRSDSTLFLIVPGHELPGVEDIVAKTDELTIVCKHKGPGAKVARATDPRS
jgi:hypothetical protein